MNFPPSANPPPNSSDEPSDDPLISPTRFFVRFSIVLLTVMSVSMVGLLYYFWYQHPAPATSLLLVIGDETFEGAVIRVEGIHPPAIQRTIDKAGKYQCRIPLAGGTYAIQIDHLGRTLMRLDLVKIADNNIATIDLKKLHERAERLDRAATRPGLSALP